MYRPANHKIIAAIEEPVVRAGRQRTVLVIDDEPDMCSFLSNALMEFGFAVLTAQDSGHGLELFKQHRPDLILLDLNFPQYMPCGENILKEVVSFDPITPVLIFTGAPVTPEMASELTLTGAKGFLTKPFKDLNGLRMIINERIKEADNIRFIKHTETVGYQRIYHELVRSQKEFEALVMNTSTSIFEYANGHFVFLNPSFEKEIGYPLKDLQELDLHTFVHPDSHAAIDEHVKHCFDHPYQEHRTELKLMTSSGTIRWVKVVSIVVDLDDTPTLIGSASDITVRKEELRRISILESLFREHLRSIPVAEMPELIARTLLELSSASTVAVNIFDPDTKEMTIANISGNEDLLEQVWQEYQVPFVKRGHQFKIDDLSIQALRSDTLITIPQGLYTLWGKAEPKTTCLEVEERCGIRSVLTQGLVNEGRLIGNIVIMARQDRDNPPMNKPQISIMIRLFALMWQERIKTEQLSLNEQRYHAFFDNISDAALTLNAAGKITDCNAQTETLFKYPAEMILKDRRTLLNIAVPVTPSDRQALKDMRKTAHMRGSANGEIRYKNGDGDIIDTFIKIKTDSLGNQYVLITDITEQKRAEYLRGHDEATGLPNSQSFLKELERAYHDHTVSGKNFAVLSLVADWGEMDALKLRYQGQNISEKTLLHLSQELTRVLPSNTVLARGKKENEFLCLYHGLQDPKNDKRFEEILNKLSIPITLYRLPRTEHITFSIGITTSFDPVHDRPENILTNMDTARKKLKDIKIPGETHISWYDPTLDEQNRSIQEIRTYTKEIAQNGFKDCYLKYQPIWDHRTKTIHAVEVLFRCDDPKFSKNIELLIKIAEENKERITALDAWVLERACTEARDWGNTKICVNVSPLELDEYFLDRVIAITDRCRFPRQRLIFEVTERSFVNAQSIDILRALVRNGIELSVDDFLSGNATFHNVSLYSDCIHYVKLDKGVVNDLENAHTLPDRGKSMLGITEGMIETFHTKVGRLIRVIGEGIDSANIVQLLKNIDVDLMQGYFLGRPENAKTFAKRFNRKKHAK